MNPVDHPHGGVSSSWCWRGETHTTDTSCRVTTNILVRRRPSLGTLPRVKRRVLLPPEGQVCCVVLKRRRNKAAAGLMVSLGWCYIGLLATSEGTAKGRNLVALRASTLTFGATISTLPTFCDEFRVKHYGRSLSILQTSRGIVGNCSLLLRDIMKPNLKRIKPATVGWLAMFKTELY
jgi:hypothetical protein